tara:strand:+ start:78 stop:449 length:372 start_codon:yes stop_codon:yes gene_type:complete
MIKLLLLKSGEDIIANVEEMGFGEGENRRVGGYYLNKPCVVKLLKPVQMDQGNEDQKGYRVSFTPWMPLSADETIPVVADWVVTMVDPAEKLLTMYIEDVLGNGPKTSESSSSDEQPTADNAD